MSAIGALGGPGTGATPPQPTILTLKSPDRAIMRLPVGARLDALVLPGGGGRDMTLRTPHGKLTLATPHPLPPGASLTLELRSTGDTMRFAILAASAQGKTGGTGTPVDMQGRNAPTPRTETQPGGSPHPLSSAAGPAANTGGTSPLAALLGLRAGLRAWIEGERPGRPGAIEGGGAGVRDHAGRAEPDGWRLVPMPLIAQGENRLARLWLRSPSADRPHAPIEIMLEMHLPATGFLRFEGALLDSRFDLVLASENPLPAGLIRELRRVFARAGGAVGLAGRFSVTPMTKPAHMPVSGSAPGILA